MIVLLFELFVWFQSSVSQKTEKKKQTLQIVSIQMLFDIRNWQSTFMCLFFFFKYQHVLAIKLNQHSSKNHSFIFSHKFFIDSNKKLEMLWKFATNLASIAQWNRIEIALNQIIFLVKKFIHFNVNACLTVIYSILVFFSARHANFENVVAIDKAIITLPQYWITISRKKNTFMMVIIFFFYHQCLCLCRFVCFPVVVTFSLTTQSSAFQLYHDLW